MERTTTERGFGLYKFLDTYQNECHIQKSSSGTEYRIWFGIHNPRTKILSEKGWVDYPIHPRVLIESSMHLNQVQVRILLPTLQKFVETGEI